jgi:hypothetical protein
MVGHLGTQIGGGARIAREIQLHSVANGGLPGWLPGREDQRFWVSPAVVVDQRLAEGAWAVGDGAIADHAARDRKLGDHHRKAAGV